MNGLAKAIATALGAGYSPIAPGTCGTAVAVPLAYALRSLPIWQFVAVTLVITAIGIWAADRADRAWGTHDSGRIVIDEVAGYLVTMTLVSRGHWAPIVVGFVVFRFFDIVKPPPIRLQPSNSSRHSALFSATRESPSSASAKETFAFFVLEGPRGLWLFPTKTKSSFRGAAMCAATKIHSASNFRAMPTSSHVSPTSPRLQSIDLPVAKSRVPLRSKIPPLHSAHESMVGLFVTDSHFLGRLRNLFAHRPNRNGRPR